MNTVLIITNLITAILALYFFIETRTDSFTKLLNKEQFNKDVAKMKRDDDIVVIIDIDKFKLINDTKGHAYGDKVIEELSAHIRKNIRKSDRAYRIGGDEFAIITNSRQIGRRIQETCGVSVSIGIGRTYKDADRNMYINKRG